MAHILFLQLIYKDAMGSSSSSDPKMGVWRGFIGTVRDGQLIHNHDFVWRQNPLFASIVSLFSLSVYGSYCAPIRWARQLHPIMMVGVRALRILCDACGTLSDRSDVSADGV